MEEDGKPLPATEKGRLFSEGGQTAVGVEESYEHHDSQEVDMEGEAFRLDPGAVVIAAITSCTNTSNPSVMMAAGLLARNAWHAASRPSLGQNLAGPRLQGGDRLPRRRRRPG